MRINKTTITTESGQKLHLLLGVTKKDYMTLYKADYDNGDLWDYPFEELIDGTVDIQEEIYYCFIKGRCYETPEFVED